MTDAEMSLRVAELRARLAATKTATPKGSGNVWISADDRILEIEYAVHVRGVKARQIRNLRRADRVPRFTVIGARVTYRLTDIVEFHSPKSNL